MLMEVRTISIGLLIKIRIYVVKQVQQLKLTHMHIFIIQPRMICLKEFASQAVHITITQET